MKKSSPTIHEPTCSEDGIGCALELCVVGTAMPKAIPPFAVCCAALLNDDDEWSDTRVMHLLAVDVSHGQTISVIDPLANFDTELNRTLAFPSFDPGRTTRALLDTSGTCPCNGVSGCIVDASANHRAILRQHQVDKETMEATMPTASRARQFLPFSSTILLGNAKLSRIGAIPPHNKNVISLESTVDAAYQKNLAVCGPQGFGYYVRGSFIGPLRFLSMSTGKVETELKLPGMQSAVLSNPRNLEQIITLGPQGSNNNNTQFHLVNTGGKSPELVDSFSTEHYFPDASNGFISTAVCCHDPENSIVFVAFGAYTAVVHNVPWLSRGWKRDKQATAPTQPLIVDSRSYRDLAATDHPLIIAASDPNGVCLLDVRNLNVLKTLSCAPKAVMCSVRASDWNALVLSHQSKKKAASKKKRK